MFYLTSFLFLIFSPGLRGLPFLYYPALFFSLSSVIYMNLRDPIPKVMFKRSASFPYIIIFIIYSFVFLSVFSLDEAVSLPEFLISITRLLLAFIFLFSAICIPRVLFFRSFTLAIFISSSLGASVLYLQAILGFPFEFLSSDAGIRADLIRYSSSMGSLTAASIGIPLCTFSYSLVHLFLFPNGARFSSLEKWLYSIPKLFIILFWLVSTLLTLSRTAVFTSLIVVFSIYILPHILRIRVTCSFPYPLLKLRKSFLLKSIGVGSSHLLC